MPAGNNPLIKIQRLKKYYVQDRKIIRSIDDLSLEVFPKETLGLVGESGCGKSTVAKCLLGLTQPTSGTIEYEGMSVIDLKGKKLKNFRRNVGMIFQDPYASLNPRMTIGDIISEPLEIHRLYKGKEKKKHVEKLLKIVGLSCESTLRFPHEFSGGQKQRIGIARALALDPKCIICDEPISALDVSVQAQIINLLKQLQKDIGLSYLFIAHDLRIVKYLCDRVAVMYLGQIMETAPAEKLYRSPLHPYTQALLSAIPIPNPKIEKKRHRIVLQGEIPSVFHSPQGCPFATRCPHATPTCHYVRPNLKEISPNHYAACHLLGEMTRSNEDPARGLSQNSLCHST